VCGRCVRGGCSECVDVRIVSGGVCAVCGACVCRGCALCVRSVCGVCAQCVPCVCAVCANCVCAVCALCVRCVCAVCSLCLVIVCVMCPGRPFTMYTLDAQQQYGKGNEILSDEPSRT